jgi:hypothetical protein
MAIHCAADDRQRFHAALFYLFIALLVLVAGAP